MKHRRGSSGSKKAEVAVAKYQPWQFDNVNVRRWKQNSFKSWLEAGCSHGDSTLVLLHSLSSLITRLVSLIEGEL